MAARNFTSAGVNNLWSNPANWDGGASPPVNNDSVTIPLGQVCEFDADLSGFADGIDGITITGTLSLTRTPGTYYLKIKAAKTIGGAGTFDCGTALSPIPFAAKHTITGGAGWYIKGNDGAGMTMTVYAAEPAIKTVLLTGAESAGATVLEVDTDITGDIWQDGDTIRIDNIAGAKSSEERIIAAGGRAAGAITITAGLTGAQMAGATVILITRNVVFLASGNLLSGFTTGKLTIGGGRFSNGTGYALNGCIGAVINGGAFSNFNRFADACNDTTVNGGVFSFFNAIFNACFGTVVNGGHISAAINIISSSPGSTVNNVTARGGEALLAGSAGCTINGGTVIGAKWPIKNSSAVIKNASFTGSTFSDAFTAVFTAFNTLFASTNENTNYNQNAREAYSDSYDHDQVPGAYKAWTKGGVTTLQTTTKPTGHASAMQTVLENAAVEGYWQKEITVTAGASVSLEMWLRKDGAMAYLPRCIVFNKAAADPFAGGAGLRTFTMTNSVDTWESDTYTYTNTGTADVTLVIRFQGMAASGNVFSELVAEVINVDLTAALAQLAAIKAKTDNLPTDPADQSLLEAAISAIPVGVPPTVEEIRQ